MVEPEVGKSLDNDESSVPPDQALLYAQDLARMNASRRALLRRLADSKPAESRKVLIADDEPSLRVLVAATLASEEYDILEAIDGEQALEIIRTERPQVVLLDVRMPIISGLEVCRLVKSDVELGGTRVVMLTGAATPEDVAAGEAAGADLYLTKPFRPLELLDVIARAMR